MASKFMAFEGVASTSASSMENYGDTENERIEMNSSQYPNYESNHNPGIASESTPYGAEEDDLNENFEEKFEKNLSYRKFIYNNSEQLKCICGGLLLLVGSGIHVVWGIFRVFSLYECKEENSFHFRFVIWSWYLGAIGGSISAGYAVAKFRKGRLYFIGGALLTLSGTLLMFSSNNTDIYLLVSRTIGGYTQGLIYVVVIVHASDNATKEFREFLMLIVGATLNYSILLSVLAFFHTEGLFKSSVLNGIGLILFGLSAIVITTKHATETVPFILQNDGSELDALQTVSKLKKKPIAARSVHHDFLTMKNLVHDEIECYGPADFKKVLLPENRKSLIFCCYGRLCSVLSLNLPMIVMIMLFLRHWTDGHFDGHHTNENCLSFINGNMENIRIKSHGGDEIEINAPLERSSEYSRPKRDISDIKESEKKPKFMEHDTESANEKKNDQTQSSVNKKKDDEKLNESTTKTTATTTTSTTESNEKQKNDNEKHEQTLNREEENRKNLKGSHEEKSQKDGKVEPKQSTKNETKLPTQAQEHEIKQKPERSHHDHHKNHKPAEEVVKPKATQNERSNEFSNEKDKQSNDIHKDSEKQTVHVKNHEIEKSSPFFLAHLLTFLDSRELTLVLLAWFIFGTITTALLYKLNLKRFIYYISCVLSSVLAVTGIAHSFEFLSNIMHIGLIVYFNYVTIPIDVFGHCMLAEAFPVTLKAFSIACVAIMEHVVHIIVITLYLSDWFHNSILLLMCIVAFVSHEIAQNLPQKYNLTLAQAREQYQNINLMLFTDPKAGYNQQEFI